VGAHGGGSETFAAILNVPGGGGAIPRELVPVVQAAVEHSMASVPPFLSSFSFGSGLGGFWFDVVLLVMRLLLFRYGTLCEKICRICIST